jgi:hypothetical protein
MNDSHRKIPARMKQSVLVFAMFCAVSAVAVIVDLKRLPDAVTQAVSDISNVWRQSQKPGAAVNRLSNDQPGTWYTHQQSVRDKPSAQFGYQHSVD